MLLIQQKCLNFLFKFSIMQKRNFREGYISHVSLCCYNFSNYTQCKQCIDKIHRLCNNSDSTSDSWDTLNILTSVLIYGYFELWLFGSPVVLTRKERLEITLLICFKMS